MPRLLRRVCGFGDLHFATFCCYQRRAFLGSCDARNVALRILGETRERFGFALVGYVLMPEHVHLLLSEAEGVEPAQILQVFKQRVSQELGVGDYLRFWQRRYYDFNVHTAAKMGEKLDYMHQNPVRTRLVAHPGDWAWSSWRSYYRDGGLLAVDRWPAAPSEVAAE